MNAWTITKDYFADPDAKRGTNSNAVGMTGPHGIPTALTAKKIAEHPDAKPFRMLDDDNTLCYEGFLIGDDDFAPLDDFGEPNAGCTRIQVLENGAWVEV